MTSRIDRVAAECQACDFTATGLNALALAAQHYDRHGHPVRTTITRIVNYGDAGDHGRAREAAGQTTLIPPDRVTLKTTAPASRTVDESLAAMEKFNRP